MPHLLTLPGPELPPDLRCQIVSFMRVYAPQVFQSKPIGWDFVDAMPHPVSVALVEQNILISHALVTWRWLTHAEQAHKMYGLSAVFTYPEFRGQGYGHQVVSAATRYILESAPDAAMLRCKPELYPFYQASGWITMESARLRIGAPDAAPEMGRVMMLFISKQGQQSREVFEREPVYVGEYMW